MIPTYYYNNTYHHTYHNTYYRSAGIGFQCGICGRFSRAQQRVPQCGVCMIPLCTNCNRFGFCPKHFEALTPEDQTQAQATSNKMKQSQYIFIGGMVIGIIAFMATIPLMISTSWYGGFNMGFIFLPFVFFMVCIIGGSVYFQHTTRRGWETLQAIGQKYRTGQETPVGLPSFPTMGPQGACFPPQPTYPSQAMFTQTPAPYAPAPQQPPVQSPTTVAPAPKPLEDAPPKTPATRFCPYCGCNLNPAAQFCSNCGSAVK
jgi:hypothetical protein